MPRAGWAAGMLRPRSCTSRSPPRGPRPRRSPCPTNTSSRRSQVWVTRWRLPRGPRRADLGEVEALGGEALTARAAASSSARRASDAAPTARGLVERLSRRRDVRRGRGRRGALDAGQAQPLPSSSASTARRASRSGAARRRSTAAAPRRVDLGDHIGARGHGRLTLPRSAPAPDQSVPPAQAGVGDGRWRAASKARTEPATADVERLHPAVHGRWPTARSRVAPPRPGARGPHPRAPGPRARRRSRASGRAPSRLRRCPPGARPAAARAASDLGGGAGSATGTRSTEPAEARTTLGEQGSTEPSASTTPAAPAASAVRSEGPERCPGRPRRASTRTRSRPASGRRAAAWRGRRRRRPGGCGGGRPAAPGHR